MTNTSSYFEESLMVPAETSFTLFFPAWVTTGWPDNHIGCHPFGIILFGNPVSGVVLVFLTNHEHGIQILKSGILLFNGYGDYSTNNGKSGCERELEKW